MKFFSPKPSITPAEAAAGLGAREFVLVDVRAPDELAASRVRGAVNMRGGVIAWTRAELPLSRQAS